jgi:hypothetical protein
VQQLSLFPPLVQFDHGRIQGPLPEDAPVAVSNGVGVNSMAMLLLLHRLGITPDAIVTALVGRGRFGNEHRRFYNLPARKPIEFTRGMNGVSVNTLRIKRIDEHFQNVQVQALPLEKE